MSKYPEYVMRTQLAELSGVNAETIGKYSDLGLLSYVEGRHRRYKTQEAIKRLKEISRLKNEGYTLEMIKDKLK